MDIPMGLHTGEIGGTITTIIIDPDTGDVKEQLIMRSGYLVIGAGYPTVMNIMWMATSSRGQRYVGTDVDILFDFLNKQNPRKNRGYFFV